MNRDMPLIRCYLSHQKLQDKPHNNSYVHSSPGTQAANTSLCQAHSRDFFPGVFSSCPWLPSSCNYFSFIDPNDDDFDSKSLRERSPNAKKPITWVPSRELRIRGRMDGLQMLCGGEGTPSQVPTGATHEGMAEDSVLRGILPSPPSNLDLEKMILQPRGVSQQLCSVWKMSYFEAGLWQKDRMKEIPLNCMTPCHQ